MSPDDLSMYSQIDIPCVAREILDGTHGQHISTHIPHLIADKGTYVLDDKYKAERAGTAMQELERARNALFLDYPEQLEDAKENIYQQSPGSVAFENAVSKMEDILSRIPENMRMGCFCSSARINPMGAAYITGDVYEGCCYVVAEDVGNAARGLLIYADELPEGVRDVLIVTPSIMSHPALNPQVRNLLDSACYLYDERERHLPDNIMSFLPDDVFVESLIREIRAVNHFMFGEVRAGFDWEAVYAGAVPQSDEKFWRKIVNRRAKARWIDPLYEYIIRRAADGIELQSYPPAFREAIEKLHVVMPIGLHIAQLAGYDTKDIPFEYDFAMGWKEYGGDSYLEALAAGVPMADLLA